MRKPLTPDQKKRKAEYDKIYRKKWRNLHPEYGKEYYKKNVEKYQASSKLWRENNREKIRGYASKCRLKNIDKFRIGHRIFWYKKKYNMSINEYNKIFEIQKGYCLICGIHQDKLTKLFAVDHDHTTDKIRGLLCGNCNTGLGLFKDDISNLKKAIEYLEAK